MPCLGTDCRIRPPMAGGRNAGGCWSVPRLDAGPLCCGEDPDGHAGAALRLPRGVTRCAARPSPCRPHLRHACAYLGAVDRFPVARAALHAAERNSTDLAALHERRGVQRCVIVQTRVTVRQPRHAGGDRRPAGMPIGASRWSMPLRDAEYKAHEAGSRCARLRSISAGARLALVKRTGRTARGMGWHLVRISMPRTSEFPAARLRLRGDRPHGPCRWRRGWIRRPSTSSSTC